MSAASMRTGLAVVTVAILGVVTLAGAAGGASRKGDRISPTAPTNVHVTGATPTAVAVAWDPSTDNVGVAGYYVYVGNKRTTVSTTSYTVTGLACGQSAAVSVAAFDKAGNRSSRASATVSTAACPDVQPPSTPTGFSESASTQTQAVLTWTPSQDNVGVVGYGVYKDMLRVNSTTDPSVDLSGLSCGSTYTYGVDAVDAAGNRSLIGTAFVQTEACGDLQAPSAPTDLAVTGTTSTSISLAWSPSTDDVGVAGYRVSVGGALVLTVEQTSATVELSCGTGHTLAVEAYDAVGHISAPTTINASTAACAQPAPPLAPSPPSDTTPPSTPTGLASSNITQTSLGLSWNASTDDVGVAGYDVYRDGTKVASVTSTLVSQASLTCGTAYGFGVVAYDAAGNRSQTAQLSVATASCASPPPSDTTPPSTPTGLASSNITETSLTLSWTASTDNVGVAGYDLSRDGTKLATLTATSWSQSGLTCGTSYSFAIVAFDAAGNRSQPASLTVSTTACSAPAPAPSDTTPPSQPSSLAVSASTATSVSLTWAASSDNVGVTGYQVYVNGSAGPTSSQPGATVSGLACGTAYTFAVDAYDAAGNRSTKASLVGSTAACADTQAPSAPTNLVTTSRTATSIALSWTAATDNVGVTGYGLYRGGTQTGTSSTTSAIFSGLTCNTSYTLSVDAADAAGNRSSKTAVMVSTTACPDTTAPSTPTNLAASNVSDTGLTLTWSTSSDNVGVSGYDVYRNGTKMETVTTTSSSQTGLACATSYTLGVVARDAAGNSSQQAQLTTSTAACPTTTPPPTSPTSQANLWIDPNGGSCQRQATAGGYADAAACGSVTAACTAAQPGDTVRVLAGSYGDQRTACKETGWVSYYLDPSATFSAAGPTTGGNFYMKFIGGTINDPTVSIQGSAANYIWFENNNATFNTQGPWQHIVYLYGHDITLIGPGEMGPNVCTGANATPEGFIEAGSYNILIKGWKIHDLSDVCHSGDHSESFYIYGTGNTHDITFDSNQFYAGDDSTSTLFITGGNNYNITIRNNFFSSNRSPYPFYIETQTPSVSVCDRYTIEYNSFNAVDTGKGGVGDVFLFQCSSKSNVVIRGNVMPYTGCDGNTNQYNVYQYSGSVPSCGSNNTWVAGTLGKVDHLGYVNPAAAIPDLHLTASSPARNAGSQTTYPSTAIDGQLRPVSLVDAGADERS